jgi:predicted alpha/beta superfamily hydrolase
VIARLRLHGIGKALVVSLAVALVPSAHAAPVVDKGPVEIGRTYAMKSNGFGSPRDVSVYVPKGCTTAKPCPGLYLIDGGVDQDFIPTVGLSKLGELVRMYPDFVVVGVRTSDRRNELTFRTRDPAQRKEVPTSGGSARFRRYVLDELKPWVSTTFPVSGRSLIMGESFAGLFVLETALKEPGAFDDYIAVSPSMWWDHGSLADLAAEAVPAMKGRHSLYLTYGNEGGEHAAGTDRIVATLRSSAPKGLRWTFRPRAQEDHSTIYHGAALDALRWVFTLDS